MGPQPKEGPGQAYHEQSGLMRAEVLSGQFEDICESSSVAEPKRTPHFRATTCPIRKQEMENFP